MNEGSAIFLHPPILDESQQACVDLLRQALAEAERGEIRTVGIVVCMESGYATVMAGSCAGDLYLGVASLARKILDAVENSPKTKAVSKIIRARPV